MNSSMYTRYFGLERDPFALVPNPEFYYPSQYHSTTLEWMKYAVEQHEMGLVIGRVGSGKTVILRLLADSLPQDRYRIACIVNPQLSPAAFVKEIAASFIQGKLPYFKRDVLDLLLGEFVRLRQKGVHPVLLIDEAQLIPRKQVFDELRLFTNFQTDEDNLLSIILFGQPELKRRFKHPAYRPFLERFRFTMELEALPLTDATDYLTHRLHTAGAQGTLPFDSEAVVTIWKLAEGTPRVINHLASFAMLHAMTQETHRITAANVESAARDILYLQDRVA